MIRSFLIPMLTLAAAGFNAVARAETDVAAAHKHAWSENVGWMNWRDAGEPAGFQGAQVQGTFLAGFVWAENAGWINLGDGAPAGGLAYANVDGADCGVNRDPQSDELSGLAWGENVGWINFDGGALLDVPNPARIECAGAACRLRGYVWGENIGGISLDDEEIFVGLAPSGATCTTHSDCADLDHNGIRDDNCLWWACADSTCVATDISFADMGGPFGACPPDGTADGNDRFHALNCFSDRTTDGQAGYPCEELPPLAYNVDAGGQFGNCLPDGVCDGNDAFAALNAFSGTTGCSCPSGSPGPLAPQPPDIVDQVTVELVASSGRVAAGDRVEVDVFITGGVSDLRGYQLHAGASRGLELIDMFIDDRKDHVFAGRGYWDAYNLRTQQILVGMDGDGVERHGRRIYLATAAFQVTAASGTLLVDLLHDHRDPAQRTYLFPTPASSRIEIREVVPAVIHVDDEAKRQPR